MSMQSQREKNIKQVVFKYMSTYVPENEAVAAKK